MKSILLALLPLTAITFGQSTPDTAPIYQKGFLSKQDALESLQIPEGYKLDLVLSDPIIQEPVTIAWDGNGAMYVAEMRTYMQDANATGEQNPTSRISRHVDTNGDGIYDKHTVFIDNILLPRMILPLDDRILVNFTNSLDFWTYRDTNNDGIAEEKIKVYEGGPRGGNMEHQPSGLIWNLDNWIYTTYNPKRFRFVNGKIITEPLPGASGQWGLTHDDQGRLYYSIAGAERSALNFHQPPQYGLLQLSGQLKPGFNTVYPIDSVPDVQGGPSRLNKAFGLNRFTGCGGQTIFRGNNLPADLYGDLILPEPVGRLIRRAKVTRANGKTTLDNATPGSEWIRTRDINFRPVQATTGPDGCLYIVDMHRGIIQQGNWTKKGSYLRKIIDRWGLDKNIGRGRIYRLSHKDHKPATSPTLLDSSPTELVKNLSHPNGWHRDTAKKLIILHPKGTETIPALTSLAEDKSADLNGRINALWTLEGLNALTPSFIQNRLVDENPLIVTNTIRLSEPFIKSKNQSIITALTALANTTDPEIAIQLSNSITYSNNPALTHLQTILLKNHPKLEALTANLKKHQDAIAKATIQAQQRKENAQLAASMERGEQIYQQLCSACHGANAKGQLMGGTDQRLAPPLAGSSRVTGNGQALIRILLHGMHEPIDGITYPGSMQPMKSQNDEWIADISNYIRNNFNNKASELNPEFVKKIRAATKDRTEPFTLKELNTIAPPKNK